MPKIERKANQNAAANIAQWPQIMTPLADLKPYERNPRKVTPEAYERLKSKIQRFGYHGRILATQDMRVIGGHLRLRALRDLGIDPVAVLVAPRAITADEYRELMITDNLQDGEWDADILAADFEPAELEEWGMPDNWISQSEGRTEGLTDPDEVPELSAVPVSVSGDMWALGAHRLGCGDSTNREQVEKMLNGVKPDMVFTDPPYGIEVVRKDSRNGFDSAAKAGSYAPIIGDNSIKTALDAYALCVALKVKILIFWGGNFYAHALPPAKCWVVWDKETDGNFGDGEIAYCNADKSIRIFRHKWSGMLKASERGEKRIHPTQKPVALAEWAFEEFGKKSRFVLDLFLGSGSTLIACEKTGRQCFGMEMSPDYCDLIIARWQNFTGKEAMNVETGETFAQMAQRRNAPVPVSSSRKTAAAKREENNIA